MGVIGYANMSKQIYMFGKHGFAWPSFYYGYARPEREENGHMVDFSIIGRLMYISKFECLVHFLSLQK